MTQRLETTVADAGAVSVRERTCDSEPIHVPGSIQPHGSLLLFDAGSHTLVHWAGEVGRILGVEPVVAMPSMQLLGKTIAEVIASPVLVANKEAIHVGSIEPMGKPELAVVASRTGLFIAVELQSAGEATTAAIVLEQVRSVSDDILKMSSLADAYDAAVAHVRATTGYDHVMVYKFLPDGSGSVVAEARAPDVTALINHRFPGSDIPAQARELYRRNLIRVIPDVTYEPAPLQPASAVPIDMSHCVLRSVSPVHLQYLKNMGVGASMSVSLMVNGELWGLIACHHRSARHLTAEARLLCRHVGTALSAFIISFGHAEYARRGAACSVALEKVLKSLRAAIEPERKLRSSAKDLVGLVDCGGFALLSEGNIIARTGQLPDATRLRELAALLQARGAHEEWFATDQLSKVFPLASEMSTEASGLLAAWVEASPPLLALWVRPEQIEEISWAGDPRLKDAIDEPLQILTPRRSFSTWQETVRGRSRRWTQHEINVVQQFQGRAAFIMQRHRLGQLNRHLGKANSTLSALATTDALTGLPNRRLFDERMQTAWQRAVRNQSSIAVIAIDVDNFKKYNDRFGHPAGDECLKQVADAIGRGHRQVDLGARLGGEEFGLLLPDLDSAGAVVVAERVRLAVERLVLDHPLNNGGIVTISLGIAAGSPARWNNPAQLLRAADEALYKAKTSGRNQIFTAD